MISELEDNTYVELRAGLGSVSYALARNGSEYATLSLVDSSGKIEAKYWSIPQSKKSSLVVGEVFAVKGNVSVYEGSLQISIKEIVVIPGIDPLSFAMAPVPSATDNTKYILRRAESILDKELSNLLSHLLQKVGGTRLRAASASKFWHHSKSGELVDHIVGMLTISSSLVKARPFLNADLLDTAIILHDIAKIDELKMTFGVVTDYTQHGQLFGHIVMLHSWISVYREQQGLQSSETLDNLQHILLAHHNLGEWGSPVQPKLPEAVALHYIDQLDSKVMMSWEAVSQVEPGEWTGKVFALENQRFYRQKEKSETISNKPLDLGTED